jgi:hypothetical protein
MGLMANQEQIEATVSFVARMVISLVLPLWGLLMILAGIISAAPSWIICGAAVVGTGLVLAAGNPKVWEVVGNMEMRPPRS